jgi:hypothetical protein
MLQLMSGLRQLRLRRLAQMQGDDAQGALARLAYQLGPNVLASRPTVLRELAAELGRWDVEFVRWAAQGSLEELLQPLDNLLGCTVFGGRSPPHRPIPHASRLY